MSEDSNFDKDSTKRAKKKPAGGNNANNDFKQQSKKGTDKNYNKDQQQSTGKIDQPLSNQDNFVNKGHKNDSHNNQYKQKNYPPRSRKESRDYAPTAWKRKHAKVPKDFILEFYNKTIPNKELEGLAASVSQLFKKDKQVPVNHEPFTLDPNEGLIPKVAPTHTQTGTNVHHTSTSTANTSGSNTAASSVTNLPSNTGAGVTKNTEKTTPTVSNPTQPAERFDFSADVDDPILAMRQKMKGGDNKNAQKPAENANKSKEPEKLETKVTSQEKNKENSPLDKKEQEATPANKDDDKYSDIDENFERKLKNNEVEEVREDAFDDLYNNEQLKHNQLDSDTRPEWEDDAPVSKDDFISKLPQDKKAIFGDKYVESQRFSENSDSTRGYMNRSGTKDTSADFSKASFDNEQPQPQRGSYTESFGQEHNDYYTRSIQQQQQQGGYGQNAGNANYYSQDVNQNAYAGQRPQKGQQQQQYGMQSGYGGQQQQQKQQVYSTQQQQQQTQQPPASNVAASNFIFKYFSPDYDAKLWSYIDLEQRVQGPYSGRTMDEWFSKGYLPATLHVTIGKNNGYRTIKELSEVINNHNAGQSTPKQEATHQRTPSQQEIPTQQYQQPQRQQQYQQQGQQQYQQQSTQQYGQQQQPGSTNYQQQQYINEVLKQHPELLQQYAGNMPALISKLKSMDLSQYDNQYSQQQTQSHGQQQNPYQQQQQGSYGGYAGKGQVVMETPTITYQHNYGGQQEQQQKQSQPYNPYKGSPGQSLNTSQTGYHQESNVSVNPYNKTTYQQPQGQNYNQGGYNQQQQKQQYKGGYQGQGQNYQQGQSQQSNPYAGGMGQSQGGNYMGGSGNMYGMQQQQRSSGMGINQNVNSNEMALKNMLGMGRPSSRQGDPDYQ